MFRMESQAALPGRGAPGASSVRVLPGIDPYHSLTYRNFSILQREVLQADA